MPQDRRTAFQTTQPHRPSADCAAAAPQPQPQRRIVQALGAVQCDVRGNPAHVRPSSRPDAAGRSSTPRSGIHTATCAVARKRSPSSSSPAHPPVSVSWRQPNPTTTTSQPSTSSAAAADLQGNQLGPWSAADIGYTHATLPPGSLVGHSGAPTHPPTHPLPPRPGETAARYSDLNFCRKIAPRFSG